jgi:hypothetical protein
VKRRRTKLPSRLRSRPRLGMPAYIALEHLFEVFFAVGTEEENAIFLND